MRKIEFYRHNIDNEDRERVLSVLISLFLTTGSAVKEFEDTLSGYLNVAHTVGVTSCTAALHLCLLAWNIGPGDEVITTPMSFCATSNAIIHASARPVFVDVEPHTGNIDAEKIEEALTEKTKAIIPVHLYGQMCDMKKIRQIADRHNLVIIEDAAHAIEAEREGIKPGQTGDAACFSFYTTKNITSGEGGAICTNNAEKADLLKMLRLHGMDKSASDRYTKNYQHWDMPHMGWKYNMDNIHGALLIGQLERINSLHARRKTLWHMYREWISGVDNITILQEVDNSRHGCHLFTVHVPSENRDEVLYFMQQHGIGVAVNYSPIHLLTYYRKTFGYNKGDFPIAEDIGDRTVSLPFYPLLKDDELICISETLRKYFDNR